MAFEKDSQVSDSKDGLSDLSIIIVTFDGNCVLKECLDSITLHIGESPQIVVVDNGNDAFTKNLVARYRNAIYVPSPENRGFAGGNNLGILYATGKYILLLNNDTVINGDSFTPLIDFLHSNTDVGIVQGTMTIPRFGLDDCGTMMTPVGIQRHLHRGESVEQANLKPRRVFSAKGAMMMFKREVLIDTGFLFYDHFRSYYEETDFCHRASKFGWETWFVPTIPITHLCGFTSGRFPKREILAQYFRNVLFSFHRNFGIFGHLFTIPCFAIAAFVKSPSSLIRALWMLKGSDT